MESSNGGDTNVGSIENSIKNKRSSIEEDIKIIEDFILKTDVDYSEYNEQIVGDISYQAIQHLLSDYKKLQEEFREVDHECFRLEKKEIELEKENAKLKELMKYKIVYTKELEKDLFENASNYVIPKETIKDKLEKLKIECDKMRPYRDVSPHDFGYINGKIDMLAGLLRDDGE